MSAFTEEQEHYLGELRELILKGPAYERPTDDPHGDSFAGAPSDPAARRWDVAPAKFNIRCASIAPHEGDGEVVAAFEQIGGLLVKMAALARSGNVSAGYHLAHLAHHAYVLTEAAGEVNEKALEGIRSFARQSEEFPVFIGKHEQMRVQWHVEGAIKRYQIGEDPSVVSKGFNYFDKDGNPTIAGKWVRRLALALHERGQIDSALPPDDTAPPWLVETRKSGPFTLPLRDEAIKARFREAWGALVWSTGDKPETIKELVEAARGFRVKKPATGERASWPNERLQVREMLRREWNDRFTIPAPVILPVKRQPGRPRGSE